TDQLPDLQAAVAVDHSDESAVAAQIWRRRFTPAGQEDDLLIAGHPADATVPLLVGAGVDLQAVLEIDRRGTRWEALPLFGQVQIRQGQGPDGLDAQLVTQLLRRVQLDRLVNLIEALESLPAHATAPQRRGLPQMGKDLDIAFGAF